MSFPRLSFSKMAVRTKLVLLISVLIGCIALFISVYFPARMETQARAGLRSRAESIARMTAFGISSGLFFEDRQAVEEALQGARRNPELVYAAVRDFRGAEFAELLPSESPGHEPEPGDDADEIYEATAPVVHNGARIGEVSLGFSLSDLKVEISETRRDIAMLSLMIFVAGIAGVIVVSTFITGPLSRMAAAVNLIEAGDLTQRADVSSGDEVGRLAGSFNTMISHIQERTERLRLEIDERRRTEDALRQSEGTNRALLDAIPDLMFRIDAEGTFIDFKAPPEELFAPPSKIIGRNLSDTMPPGVARKARVLLDKALQTGRMQSFEYSLPRGDEPSYYECRLVKTESEEVLAIVRNITERKRAEQDRDAAESELEEQKALGMRADRLRSLGEMAAGIAHELNQPLVGVRGLAEHILLGLERGWELTEEKLKERAGRIVDQADRMVHIIQHVRMFAREAGRPEVKEICVNDVVRSALDLVDAQFRSRGVQIDCDLTEDLPRVLANPFSLEEVVINLLSNARDAVESADTGHGGCVVVRTWQNGTDPEPEVRLEIRDNGTGIPPGILAKVFDPFFTTKDPDKGTGLGLSVSKSIVEEVGGRLHVESQQGEGTSISVILPVREMEQDSEAFA